MVHSIVHLCLNASEQKVSHVIQYYYTMKKRRFKSLSAMYVTIFLLFLDQLK
jgi:hypothetical protein